MAKKETKRTTASRRTSTSRSTPATRRPRQSEGGGGTRDRGGESKGAADALIGLLESPLVADILAAGAAAALAAIAQRGLSRRETGSSRAALKNAAKAAAAAMGARIAEEIEEIMKSSKEGRREEA